MLSRHHVLFRCADLNSVSQVVAVITSTTDSYAKRASYCEVMRSLHVDCYPQTAMVITEPRHSQLGGELYPAPNASNPALHKLLETVRKLLFRSSEFRCGAKGYVGHWRSGPQTLALHGKRQVRRDLVQCHARVVEVFFVHFSLILVYFHAVM